MLKQIIFLNALKIYFYKPLILFKFHTMSWWMGAGLGFLRGGPFGAVVGGCR